MIIPKEKESRVIISPKNELYVNIILKNEDGIKSVILIPIIIDMENAKQKDIKRFILFSLILNNITIPPSRVDIPAIEDIKKALSVFN